MIDRYNLSRTWSVILFLQQKLLQIVSSKLRSFSMVENQLLYDSFIVTLLLKIRDYIFEWKITKLSDRSGKSISFSKII